MGSEGLANKLPVIDFSIERLNDPGSSSWIATSRQVTKALEEYGCFIAIYDRVSMEMDGEIFGALEGLFGLPKETKAKNTSHKPYFGYRGMSPLAPLYEGFGIEGVQALEVVQNFSNLMWPNGNEHFCEIIYSYSKLLNELEKMVKRMVFEVYGIDKYYDSNLESTNYLLRITKYRVPGKEETNVGVTSHTDKSFMSIVHQNDVDGLELKAKNGEWICYEQKPSSFVVLAGDAFLAWSNGRLHSPSHRVTIRGNKERYSVATFSLNKGTIEVPEELVDEEHPLQFRPFDNLGLIDFSYANPKQPSEICVKAYCGV